MVDVILACLHYKNDPAPDGIFGQQKPFAPAKVFVRDEHSRRFSRSTHKYSAVLAPIPEDMYVMVGSKIDQGLLML
jgi:hypothetical protein